jgi:hypothetical protein
MHWARAAALLALLGATLGVALDAWHVVTATTRYASPGLFGVAWWTWPLFASAPIGLGLAPVAIEHATHRRVPPADGVRVAIAVALFAVAYLVTGVVHGVACVASLAIVAIAIAATSPVPLGLRLAHAVGAAVAGPLVEITLVHAGAFFHADTSLFGVAIWLPMLYVCASLALTSLARSLVGEASAPGRSAAS